MGEIFIEIPDDFELPPGSEIQMRFEWQMESTYGRAIQWAMIESNLEKKHPEFEILSYTNTDTDLVVEIRVTEPPQTEELQTASVISPAAIMAILGIITVGIFAWAWRSHQVFLNTQAKVEYAQTTTGKIEAGSKLTFGLAALAAVAVYGLIKLK